MQKHRLLSFSLTNTTVLHHALWLGGMVPESSISHRWLQTSSTKGGGIHLNLSLKEVSSITLIMCLVEWVQPSSLGSNEKTSWYLARSNQVESASSRGHNSKPLRSSSSNSLPCLCLAVNLGACRLQGFSTPWQVDHCQQLWYHGGSHHSTHQGFLLESLGVGCTVPHH